MSTKSFRSVESSKPWVNWLIAGLFLVLCTWACIGIYQVDYIQNYVSARAWMLGLDPNGKLNDLLLTCCPTQNMPTTELVQTAHPPFATLFVLPWATHSSSHD